MTRSVSIEHAQSTAIMGKEIAIWGAGRSLELAFKGTEAALSIANRGLSMAIQRGKKAVTDTREAAGVKLERPEMIKQRALEAYNERIAATQGLLETSTNKEVIKAVKEDNGRAAIVYSNFCIENNVAVDLETARKVTNQIIEGGLGLEIYEQVSKQLKVHVPVGFVGEAEPGLEHHIGSFDPSVPSEPLPSVSNLPQQSR